MIRLPIRAGQHEVRRFVSTLQLNRALTAATRNAAATLGLPGPRGLIAPGAVADLVLLDVPSHLFLGYQLGPDPVAAVIKDGRLAYARGEARFLHGAGPGL